VIRLAVGIPAYGGRIASGHMLQAGQLSWAWCRAGLPAPFFINVDSAGVDKARNVLLAKARDAGADWLLMCDADTYYPLPQAIFEMVKEGHKVGAAVIGAPVKLRRLNGYNVQVRANEGDAYKPVEFEAMKGVVTAVDRIGTAFTAIDLHWMAEHWPESPWFTFQHLEGRQPSCIGEDYWFCAGVRQRGGIILADGRFEPIHVEATNEQGMLTALGVQTFNAND
jgi:glycosyltransferase involved in cell wall biosynthesis